MFTTLQYKSYKCSFIILYGPQIFYNRKSLPSLDHLIYEFPGSASGLEYIVMHANGGYFLQEWWDILKLYEKKNLYMAECAQQLTRNVNYEIPALKQQISRCQQTERVFYVYYEEIFCLGCLQGGSLEIWGGGEGEGGRPRC
jgi:hypothetical protein